MHFKHKKRDHGTAEKVEAAAQQPQEEPGGAPPHLVCRLHGEEKDVKLTCRLERIEEVAIPEIETGVIEHCDDLESDVCEICYETAIPEIHLTKSMLQCPAAKAGGEN